MPPTVIQKYDSITVKAYFAKKRRFLHKNVLQILIARQFCRVAQKKRVLHNCCKILLNLPLLPITSKYPAGMLFVYAASLGKTNYYLKYLLLHEFALRVFLFAC